MADARQPSVWLRPQRRSRGPEPEYRLSDIAAAAVALADAGGLGTVSMRAVAAALGTTGSTLYRYIVSRDELLDLMVDAVMATFAFEARPGADWLDEMVRVADATRSHYRRHLWLLDVRPQRSAPGPHTLAWFEHCLRAMSTLDRPGMSKMEAIGVVNGVVMLFARSESAPAAFDLSAVTPDRHPYLIGVLTSAATGGPGVDLFERTLRALLAGLLVPASG